MAENEPTDERGDKEFLICLGFIDINGQLSHIGKQLYEASFIRMRPDVEKNILQITLLKYQPTLALQQYLWGLGEVSIEQVLSVLKSTGIWGDSNKTSLTHLLDLLHYAGIISYYKKKKVVRITISPNMEAPPESVFIDPSRPYSNIMWIKKILAGCNGYIYWFDKHFQKEAFEWLWAVADSTAIKEIRIISLDLGAGNLSDEAKAQYRRLKRELSVKGITLIWSTIDSKLVTDAHDRWIIGDKGTAWNVPNVNAIFSGQRSELNLSGNYEQILKAFKQYEKLSKEILI